ncbi:hypothetical protein [Paenibacillus sp. OK003]|uniref:hypothetical protein n=1 Tax=Paenibacillus sp. OK003 TaxID=1884380 RepID=UPI0008C98CEA|nr:hypothetical protein [Paenibacillus sp. OK003]SEK97189.1 hypothetical protein SAMN05518856_106232 [Paenibacillus sp. OK003]
MIIAHPIGSEASRELTPEEIDAHADKPFILGFRISPEEIHMPGILLEDSLAFAQALTNTRIDYIHLSMGSYKRTSLNQPDDKEPILTKRYLSSTEQPFPAIKRGNGCF